MAGTIGAFGADLSSIDSMLNRRQQNAQFLRSLLSSEMEQARQAQRSDQALALQRELGLGSLALDRDRFGLEQQLGLGAQGLNRDRFNLEAELGRGAQGLASDRFSLEKLLGTGQLDLARGAQAHSQGMDTKRFGLEQELGRGSLANAMGRLGLDERRLGADVEMADKQRMEMARQFDAKQALDAKYQQLELDLRRELPALQADAAIKQLEQQYMNDLKMLQQNVGFSREFMGTQHQQNMERDKTAAAAQAIVTALAQGKSPQEAKALFDIFFGQQQAQDTGPAPTIMETLLGKDAAAPAPEAPVVQSAPQGQPRQPIIVPEGAMDNYRRILSFYQNALADLEALKAGTYRGHGRLDRPNAAAMQSAVQRYAKELEGLEGAYPSLKQLRGG